MTAAHDDVLAKMDALLKKHHDGLAPAPNVVDFPVLTEVVEEQEEIIPLLTEVVADEAEMDSPAFDLFFEAKAPTPDTEPPSLGGAALGHLDQQTHTLLEQQLSANIVTEMDKALAPMLDKFAARLESLVRDAVAQELRLQLPELLRQGEHGAPTE